MAHAPRTRRLTTKPASRRRLLELLGAAALLVGCAPSSADSCRRHDFAAFSVCTPATWKLVRGGGVDSSVGRFSDESAPGRVLRVDFDFGLYSDPLKAPAGAADYLERAIVLDGLSARQVSYSMPDAAGAPMRYLGVHVPDAGTTAIGKLRLTLLASSSDKALLQQADAAFATVRFRSR